MRIPFSLWVNDPVLLRGLLTTMVARRGQDPSCNQQGRSWHPCSHNRETTWISWALALGVGTVPNQCRSWAGKICPLASLRTSVRTSPKHSPVRLFVREKTRGLTPLVALGGVAGWVGGLLVCWSPTPAWSSSCPSSMGCPTGRARAKLASGDGTRGCCLIAARRCQEQREGDFIIQICWGFLILFLCDCSQLLPWG